MEALEAILRGLREGLDFPYPAPPGTFPQAAALGPKTCQDLLLEAERYQPENGSPRSGLWKKGRLGDQGPPFCPEGEYLQKRKQSCVSACPPVPWNPHLGVGALQI